MTLSSQTSRAGETLDAAEQAAKDKYLMRAMQQQMARLMERLEDLSEQVKSVSTPQQGRRPRAGRGDGEGDDDNEEVDQERRPRGGPRVDDNLGGIKMKIPTFKGTRDPDLYLEWERKVEASFDCYNYSEAKKVKLAVVEFSDYAYFWWGKLLKDVNRGAEVPIATWADLKRALRKRFVPTHFHRELQQRLQSLKQGSLSVDEYHKTMETAMIQAECNEDEEATMARLLNGLNMKIRHKVDRLPYVTLDELVELAVKIESQEKEKLKFASRGRNPLACQKATWPKASGGEKGGWPRAPSGEKGGAKSGDDKAKAKVESTKVGKSSNPKTSSSIICFKCQGRGHMMSECPNRRTMIINNNGVYESASDDEGVDDHAEFDEVNSDDCEEYKESLSSLAVRRALSINSGSHDNDQRENIFHARYEVNGPLSVTDSFLSSSDGSKVRISFKGVPGAYSEEAAFKAFPQCETVPCDEFEDAFKAVELWQAEKAILPLENSLSGSIHRNYDLLLRHRLHIVGEVQLAVKFCLLALPGVRLDCVKRVLSHPQALSQSDNFLSKLGVIKEEVDDTAGGAQLLAMKKIMDAGVVASSRAASIYGLNVLAENIQDHSDIITRFLVLARDPIIPRTDKTFKTSIVFSLEEGPGVLFKALAVFALRDINLTKIESRPQRKQPLRVVDASNIGTAKYFDYLFYIDFEASMAEPRAQHALGNLQEFATFLRVLGCYPIEKIQ